MKFDPARRCLLVSAVSGGLAAGAGTAEDRGVANVEASLAALESASGGRLGVSASTTARKASPADRADERLPLCSTFKLLASAAVSSAASPGPGCSTGGSSTAPPISSRIRRSPRRTPTAAVRIRTGVPNGQSMADKTGSGDHDMTNDVAVIWPSARPPIVLTVCFTQAAPDAGLRDDVIAAATRIVVAATAPDRRPAPRSRL